MGRHPPSWADAAPQPPFPPAHLEPGPSAGLPCPAPPDPGHPRPVAGPPSAQRCRLLFCPRGGGHTASHAQGCPAALVTSGVVFEAVRLLGAGWRGRRGRGRATAPAVLVHSGPRPSSGSQDDTCEDQRALQTGVCPEGSSRWATADQTTRKDGLWWQTQMVKEGGAGARGGAVSGAEAPWKQPGVTRTTGVSRDVTWIPSPVNPRSPYCQTTFKIKPHFGKSGRSRRHY